MGMEVQVRLFATLKDRAGREMITVWLPDGARVADLLRAVAEAYPSLQSYLPSTVVAINHEFAFPEDDVRPGDEVAMFPPVSGGGEDPAPPEVIALTSQPIDLNALVRAVTTPRTGAVTLFIGVVRGEEGDRQVEALEYEAYHPMAEAKMRQIPVAVAVSAGHRHEGIFEAARYGINRMKEIVPIWKKEMGPRGELWIEGDYHPSPTDAPPSSS